MSRSTPKSRIPVSSRNAAGAGRTAKLGPAAAGRYHHGNLRAELVSAAIKIVDRRGPDGLTIRLVAEQAGVSHNAPYHHFRDKGAILEAASISCINAMVDSLRRRLHRTRGNALDQLICMGVEFVRFAMEHPAEFRLIHRPELRNPRGGCCGDAPTSPVEAAWSNARQLLMEAVRRGQQDGIIRCGDPDMIVLAWWCLVNGFANKVLNFFDDKRCTNAPDPLVSAHALLEHLVNGIRNK